MLNLAKILETTGMAEKTAKGTATRITNKYELDRDEKGFIEEDAIVEALTQAYPEDSGSKYKDAVADVVAQIKAGEINPIWNEETAPASKAKSPFIKAKVLDVVAKYATDKGLTDITAVIEKATAELEEAAANK